MKNTNQNETTPRLELRKIQTDFPRVKISSSKDNADFIRQFYGDDIGIYESFFILCLDQSLTTTGYAKISQGGVAGTVVDIKIILKYAIDNLACHIVLAHNHPSGNLKPSQADISVTKRIKEAAIIMDIKVVDHIILTEQCFYSFSDEGRLL